MDQRERIGDRAEAIRTAFEGMQSELWTALPGIVNSVDHTKVTCTVQPATRALLTGLRGGQKWVDLPLLLDVPIVFPSAGGFVLTLPIKPGDEVLVVFSSRCIDAWWQSGGHQNIQAELRMHDLSDGFAIPGPRSLANPLPSFSSTSCRLQKQDGSAYLEITPAGAINIVAPGGASINGVAINSSGAINAPSTIVATGDVHGSGKSLATHVHSGVTTGGGNTGPPV